MVISNGQDDLNDNPDNSDINKSGDVPADHMGQGGAVVYMGQGGRTGDLEI